MKHKGITDGNSVNERNTNTYTRTHIEKEREIRQFDNIKEG